jgi:threonine synthase
MRADVEWATLTDDQTRAEIARAFHDHGYLLDPHSAVAAAGLRKAVGQGGRETGIVLATAHPAKFAETVEPVIGRTVELPARLADCLRREGRSVQMGKTLGELREAVRR